MLQSVAYVARIRNGYSGRNGAGQAVTGQDDVDRIRAFGVADGAHCRLRKPALPQLRVVPAEAGRVAWVLF